MKNFAVVRNPLKDRSNKMTARVIDYMADRGARCALVTDAGMPAISDPGEDLVRLCAEAGVGVLVVPGPSAVVSALALSALSTSRFAFEGFLPPKASERRKRLTAVAHDDRTLIFYEAPHKLTATLADMRDIFGENRKISLCRELTKLNEETLRLTLGEAVSYYGTTQPRGEYVLVIEGGDGAVSDDKSAEREGLSPAELVAYFEGEGLSHKDAIKAAAKDRGMTKSEFYKLLI